MKWLFSVVKECFWLQGILCLGLLFVLYILALFGHGFVDPDAFYHAKISLLLWQHGPIHSFPWLDLSLVGQHFADLHFLFHVLMAPFVSTFGMMQGLRYGMLFLMGSLAIVFAGCLRWLHIRYSWFWVFVCLSSAPLLIRLSLGKASALALLWFVIGITASLKQRPWVLAFSVFGFSLSHGGWMILVGSAGILSVSRFFFEGQLQEKKLLLRVRFLSEIRLIFASFLGAALGIFVHPNFPENIQFTWVQLVTIGLKTPMDRVVLGKEWYPPPMSGVISGLAPLLLLSLLLLVGFIFARKSQIHREQAIQTLQLGSLFAFFFALSLSSIRSIEYAIPVFILFFCSALQFIDLKKMFFEQRILSILAVVFCFFVQIFHNTEAISSLRTMSFSDTQYQVAVLAMRQAGGKNGDRIFHTMFGRFPLLFAQDDGFRYVTGLDPTFLLITNPALSDRIDASLRFPSKTTIHDWNWMISTTHSRFVFIPKIGKYSSIFQLLDAEKNRYSPIFEDEKCKVYQVTKWDYVEPK
ncbi:hypothetical protein IT408_03600 [Candidatus Uhrbacteria bacterium]|nr:hypothetical protein [Candidatus Uhrbacteria bacterium]